MELKKRLRQAREDASLSVNDVADYLGVGRAQIWRMETKSADFISVGRLRKLADKYGRSLAYFFDDRLESNDAEVSYQLIGMAVSATEFVAARMVHRPSPMAMQAAVLATIRAQQERWSDDPNSMFNQDEFIMLIEQQLKRGQKR
jgi:transcriptional regulator with XRE-family HTH domain